MPRLSRAGGAPTVTLAMAVMRDDEFTTGPSDKLTITLSDGSKLLIGEDSQLRIDEHVLGAGGVRATTSLTLLAGLLRSVVVSVGGRPNFLVHTPNAVAAARGTDFTVEYSEGRARLGFPGCGMFTDVSVASGVVAVANVKRPTQTVDVHEGYSTTVPCYAAPLTPGPMGLAGSIAAPAPAGAAPPPMCPVCPPSMMTK